MPRFDGVPGQIVAGDSLDGISFSASKHRVSPYDALLDDLLAETRKAIGEGKPMPALRFGDVRAKVSVRARAKKKEFKLEFADAGGVLYVRMNVRALPAVSEPAAESGFDAQLLGVLKASGPLNHYRLAVKMREQGNKSVDAPMCDAACHRLAKKGVLVKREDGTFALNHSK